MVRLSLLNVDSVGAFLPLFEPFNLTPPALNRDAVSTDLEFDRIDEVDESSPAEQEDVSRRPTGVANVVDVMVFISRKSLDIPIKENKS